MANATATTCATHNRRCGGCRCVAYLIIIPIGTAMLMEFLFGVWFMQQRQGLWPPLTDVTHTNRNIVGSISYTRTGRFELLERVPHDTNAFTQGLVMIQEATPINDDETTTVRQHLYEGTGMYGASQLRRLDIQTGKVLAFYPLEKAYFGEGIAHYRDKDHRLHIVQLTWKKQRAFEYIFHTDTASPPQQQQHRRDQLLAADDYMASWKYRTTTNEGWGITYSPSQHVWYVSDGSEYIHVWNVDTKQEIRKFAVTYQHANGNNEKIHHTRTAIQMINELEYDPVTDTILANVWRENIIIRIDPQTGFVTTMYDLNDLLPNQDRNWHTDVLNGIALAYDATVQDHAATPSTTHPDELWVTGKYWPYMFRIRLIDNVGIEIDNNDKTCSI